jgi:hypothetical protein
MVKRYKVTGDNFFERESEDGKFVLATDYDALKEQRDFAVRELEAILFMLQREKGKEGK